jgi:hypothetical protein
MKAIREVLGGARRYERFKFWTLDESREISARQARYREELGQ